MVLFYPHSGDGFVVVGSKDGKLRLYNNKTLTQAKTQVMMARATSPFQGVRRLLSKQQLQTQVAPLTTFSGPGSWGGFGVGGCWQEHACRRALSGANPSPGNLSPHPPNHNSICSQIIVSL